MKSYKILAFAALGILASAFCSCEKIDEVPPKTDTTTKYYKIPDPAPMTSLDYSDFNAIRSEYENATK